MGTTSAIAWTDATWNPWQGCHKVSAGCKFCYMYRDKERYGQDPAVVVRSKPPTFKMPLRFPSGQSRRVFTCSWSDFFIEEADEWRIDAWDIIARTPHLTYQILTKRPERILDHLPYKWALGQEPPWPNVWLGVSVEDQSTANERIPVLLRTPAARHWVSYEPALGPVRWTSDWLTGTVSKISWIIVGGESGPEARPFLIAWARSTLAQGRAAGTAIFVKQLGRWPMISEAVGEGPALLASLRRIDGEWPIGTRFGNPTGNQALNGRLALLFDRAGADPREWPADLQVQEFPA